MRLTPLKVEMLLGLYYMPNFRKQFSRLNYPAQIEALYEFTLLGLIDFKSTEGINSSEKLTPKGVALVNKILAVRLEEDCHETN